MTQSEKSKIPLQIVNGIRFPSMFKAKTIQEAFDYKPRSDDVIIVTYPKCGTTWMQMVVTQIFRRGRPLEKATDFHVLSPFLETRGDDGVAQMPRPGPIKIHLPYDRMPYSPEAKYIFVIRNPFDACVSMYYHTYSHSWHGSFDEFFEHFMDGEVEFNDYFDHLLSWYPHRNDENVFWTSYEAMKRDLRGVVLNVAGFIGQEHFEAVSGDSNVMDNILKHCEFSYMREMYDEIEESRERERAASTQDEERPKSVRKRERHIRKGIVGGWREYFSEGQYLRMKEKFETRTLGTDIGSCWPDLFQDD